MNVLTYFLHALKLVLWLLNQDQGDAYQMYFSSNCRTRDALYNNTEGVIKFNIRGNY